MLLTFISILLFSIILKKVPFFKLKEIPAYAVVSVFLLKSLAGFLSYSYHNYYFAGGDSAIYLNSGYDLISFSHGNPITYIKLFLNLNRGIPEWESIYSQIIYWDSKSPFNIINDNRNAIRINSLVSLISFNNLGVHIVVLNFLTIIGLSALYKSFSNFFQNIPPILIFVAVFLSPSILFWTSGILKETHTLLILGLYFFYLSKLIKNKNFSNLLLVLLFAALLLLVRTYLALILFIATSILLTNLKLNIKKFSWQVYFILFSGLILLFIIYLSPFNLFDAIQQKQIDFIYIGKNANSFFSILPLQKPIDIFLYFPIAIINVFIQPQLFSFDSWLYLFPIIENIDILFFCFLGIRYYKTPNKDSINYILMAILIYLLSSWLIGLTVPIQGAIARYKALTQPFLLIFIFSFVDWDTIKKNYFFGKSIP